MPRSFPKASRPDTVRRERALDTALAASFPASDPVAALEPVPDWPRRSRGPVRAGARFETQPRMKDIRP